MKNCRPLLILLTLCLALSACSCSSLYEQPSEAESTDSAESTPIYDGRLEFSGRHYTYTGDPSDIAADGDRLIIKKSGSYALSGELTEGRVITDCIGEVRLCLGGVSISSAFGAPIEQKGSGGIVIESLSGTVNRLHSENYESERLLPTACVSVEGYVCLSGEGALVISSKSRCAVSAGGEIFINSGALTLSCESYGLWSKDRIRITGGSIKVTYADIGLFAYGGEYSRGLVEICGGALVAVCRETAIFAEREIRITDGKGDLQAKNFYICQRTVAEKTEYGRVTVSAEGFPPYKK